MEPRQVAVSRNIAGLKLSAIKDMAMRSANVEGAVSLAWGLPSFRTPDHIRTAVARVLKTDPEIGKYALPDGLPALRRAAAEAHRRACGITADPDREVMITAGNMQALNALLHTMIEPGDEVIVTDPGFPSHIQQVRICGGKPVFWTLDENRAWALDLDALPDLVTARTKAIVLVSPSNPTGRIFSEAELRQVGRLALAHGLLIIVDDPYSHFTYENRARYFNPAAIAELAGHVAYCFTFSKCHAMSGWRLGYVILPEALKREMLKVHDATIICAPRISQVAGLAALTGESDHLRDFEENLSGRRSLICERLDALPQVFDYVRPEGAYYIFPRIVAEHQGSVAFAIGLLETTGVAVTPGSAFGPAGEHHVRMAYCVPEEAINTAFDRIERQFRAY